MARDDAITTYDGFDGLPAPGAAHDGREAQRPRRHKLRPCAGAVPDHPVRIRLGCSHRLVTVDARSGSSPVIRPCPGVMVDIKGTTGSASASCGSLTNCSYTKTVGYMNSKATVAALTRLVDLYKQGIVSPHVLGGAGTIGGEQAFPKGQYASTSKAPGAHRPTRHSSRTSRTTSCPCPTRWWAARTRSSPWAASTSRTPSCF